MKPHFLLILATLAFASFTFAADPAPKPLFDLAAAGAIDQIKPNEKFGETTFGIKDNGIDVSVVANGKSSFPGIQIKPSTPWDATGFGHVEATVTNNGTKPFRANLRLDNEGPWQEERQNTNVVSIKPGETKVVATIFGYSYGRRAYKLDPSKISQAILFIGKSDVDQSFRITNIQAAGIVGEVPYVDPNTVAVKPPGGVIVGGDASFDIAKQAIGKAGAKVTPDGKSIAVAFSAANQSVLLKPVAGMWNLNEQLRVRVRIRNAGDKPASPRIQLTSRGGASDEFTAAPIAPGAEAEIVAPFTASKPWKGGNVPEMLDQQGPKRGFTEFEPGTGTKYASNTTQGVVILPDRSAPAGSLVITSVIADMPPRAPLPEWLGKRPPVEGDWSMTFEDAFDGDSINLKNWNIYTEGEWHLGKATGFSKDNVIVKDGKLYLRVEKRKVHHNDNPAYPLHDYATGWADSYGKWTQRYGYFEARLKLPAAPDAFTAFWLMPDRGLQYANDKKPAFDEPRTFMRNSTNGLGMEFDIMEQLSAWGPNRHDFGMHWDHYMDHHKSIGTFACYFQPDPEGFLTVGMLWTPGQVIMYQQGRESARWETPRISSLPSYLILQHITGGWETEGMDDAQLPSDLVFDYVRVWQRKDLASPADGAKPNDGGPLPPK